WMSQIDDAFINALLNEQIKGNKVDGTFTTTHDSVVKELCAQVDKGFNSNIKKDKLKNCLKTIKANFNKSDDLFKNLSGFNWSSVTKMSAKAEVWKALIDENPDAKKWMTTPIGNFDKLVELFAKDRATVIAKTAKEKRQRWANSSSKEGLDTINDIDHLVSQNEVTLENFEQLNDNIQELLSPVMPSRLQSQSAGSSKGKKRKNSNDDDYEVEIVKDVMMEIAGAIREGNVVLEKSQPRQYSEEELSVELAEIDVEPHLLTKSYIYLVRNPDMMRAFFGCPISMRKQVLMEMMNGND
ncbi:LOW QUALITY PROTEIN: Myb_DNA-bind_3 domain-containing protein, partial [Cephalotus follicularis]